MSTKPTASTEGKKPSASREFGQHVSKARLARLVGNNMTTTTSADAQSTDFKNVASNVLQAVQAKRTATGAKPNLSLQYLAEQHSSKTNDKTNGSTSVFKKVRTGSKPTTVSNSKRLIGAVMAMDNVYTGKKDKIQATQENDDDDDDDGESPTGETLPLIGNQAGTGNGPQTSGGAVVQIMSKGWGKSSYGSTGSGAASGPPHRRKAKSKSILAHLGHVIIFFGTLLIRSFSVMVGLPLLILAGIVFYVLESGVLELDFLPGNATLCWWLIFASRQCVTLDIARIIQWFLVDYIALSSKIAVRCFGPFLTLVAIQAHGWPFLATWWSLLDLTLLYGDNQFQQNWFYGLKQAIFDEDESGGNAILMSEIYLRILLCVLVAGVAASIKRTSLAMYFGQKTVVHYRNNLESVLADISVIAEVAQLADEASKIEETTKEGSAPVFDAMAIRKGLYDTKWHTMTGFAASPTDNQPSQEFGCNESEEIEGVTGVGVAEKGVDVDNTGEQPAAPSISGVGTQPTAGVVLPVAGDTQAAPKDFAVKDLLDSWDEPVNKLDKTDVSINDILQFQKALTYMDEEFPFSAEFGPATSRDDCVKSSQDVYRRLLKLSSRPDILSFEALKLLSLNENGVEDESKTSTLKRVFRPDKSAELPLLAFVQSCDAVYKRLRYFRASVRNSSVIDDVLQDIIDVFFYFALALLMLSMLNFDPWPLLASVSTLLISFSFAFGNSTARIVDGILLIAAQRPFDLGDRIVINSAEDVVNYGVDYSWYVEDINLFTTTLRFAKTNEVATVSNGTIIQSRIVNCQRSQNALVTLNLEFRLDVTEDDLEDFIATLEDFVQDHPRIWDNLVYFQCDSINSADGIMKYTLRARHLKTWQDAPQILASKAELLKFCNETSKSMGLNHQY